MIYYRKIQNTAARLMPECVKRIVRPMYFKITKAPQRSDLDPKWIATQKMLTTANRIIDLGCGNNPVRGATVGVDCYMEPRERSFVSGIIDIEKMKERGVTFINSRIDVPLPFAEKEFDFAYSCHVFEHLEDPATGCNEMMRIVRSGVIITPSMFSELIFGRPYHRWLIMQRGDKLFFFRKRSFEDRPFGELPIWDNISKKYRVEEDSNPFDILLNEGNWYSGKGKMPRLAKILQKYWYSHSPLIENVFLWEGSFNYEIIE